MWCRLFLGLLLSVNLFQGVHAAIFVEFEGPADGQPVSGIGTVQGWAFSDVAGVTITAVSLAVDGTFVSTIPCCSERGDVAAAFPAAPAENTLNSGFGITQNFNLTAPGEHTLTLTITDSNGAQATRTHTVTVVQPGGFEFLDHVDLSEASAERQGQDIVLSNVRIRDAASQQIVVINARLRWFQNRQGLGLIEATTVGPASAMKTARSWLTELRQAKTSAASLAPIASVENPGNGDTVAGAALIQGFAFARAGRSITRVQLFIDGEPSFTIPCCSDRADVANAFPDEPNARNSGFGVTFNYGLLSSGVHQLMVEIEDSAGDIRKIPKGILVRRPGEFEFLEELDVSTATVQIVNGAVVIKGAVARDSVTAQTATRIIRYRFVTNAQAFGLFEESAAEIPITSLSCMTNGDTSSIEALQNNPGVDGISLPEVIEATNNDPIPDVLVFSYWEGTGTVFCETALPAITGGNLTLDGDVDGDGAPDVALEGAGGTSPASSVQAQSEGSDGLLTVAASKVTLRGLAFRNSAETAVEILASPGMSITDVTVLGLEVEVQPAQGQELVGDGIVARAQVEAGQQAHLRAVLVSGNRIRGTFEGVTISALGVSSVAEGLTIRGVTVAENEIMEGKQDVQIRPANARGALLTRIAITNNTMSNAELQGIFVMGGVSPTANNNRIEALVTDNMVTGAGVGIALTGGFSGAESNTLEVVVADNVVQGGGAGILLDGGNEASNNTIMTQIQGNQLQDTAVVGIGLTGGFSRAENNILEVGVVNNTVQGGDAGINLQGGNASTNNTLLVDIRDNQLQDTAVVGIGLTGGFSRGGINQIDALVAENEVKGAGFGLVLAGGVESPQNIVLGEVQRNTVQDSQSDGLLQIGGWFSGQNMVDTMITDNVVTNSGSNGVEATGGTTRSRSDVMSNNPAVENLVTGIIFGNSVQNNTLTGIAVFGGFDDTNGGVVGNAAQQDIIENTADGVTCQDGIAGNRAECVVRDNTDTSFNTIQETASSITPLHSLRQRPISVAFAQQLHPHIVRLAAKEQQLQDRAATMSDERLRNRLLRLCDRLAGVTDKLTRRMAGQPSAQLAR